MSGPSENTEETGDTGPWDCGECGTSPGPAPRLDSGDTGDCGPGPGDPQPPDPKLPFWPKETLCGMLGSGTWSRRVSMSDHVAEVTIGDLLVGEQRVSGGELRVPGHEHGRQHGGLHPLVVVRVDADLRRR